MAYNILWRRIITGGILIPIVIIGIFYLPTTSFSLAVAVILSLAAWEWSVLANIVKTWQRILYIGLLWWGFTVGQFLTGELVLVVSFIWWLLAFFLVLRYPKIKPQLFTGWLSCGLSFLVLVPCLVGLDMLHRAGAGYVLLVLCIVWAADTGAYFAGMLFGKRKLAPLVSPGKTIEGLGGGIFLAIIVALIFGLVAKVGFSNWLLWIGLMIVTVLFSVLGDLFESMLKRCANVKDSGTWLPGHGGILDRIDSLTAAVPVFTLGLLLFIN